MTSGREIRNPTGLLIQTLRSKVWVLVAHAAEVSGGLAKANLFKTKYGYAAPVVLAPPNTTAVDVTLRCDTVAAAAGCGAIPRAHGVATQPVLAERVRMTH